MLRPTLLLLSNDVGGSPSKPAYGLAAIIELMHLATLVHDDSVDHSVERRGMPTVNSRWSHQVSVIVGDYLYSRAVIEISRFENIEAIRILAESANQMTIGEMRQLLAYDALGFTQDDYFELCAAKTASLIAAACELGAMVGEPEFRPQLREFGYNFGMVFQITDDLLDYTVTSEVMGKPSGADLREHKVTLPLIAALPALDATERSRVEQLRACGCCAAFLRTTRLRIAEAEGLLPPITGLGRGHGPQGRHNKNERKRVGPPPGFHAVLLLSSGGSYSQYAQAPPTKSTEFVTQSDASEIFS